MDLLEARSDSSRRHPWERVRFRFLSRVLTESAALAPGTTVLDVGSGDGWFGLKLARALPPAAKIVCWDTAYELAGPPHRAESLPIAWTAQRPQEPFDVLLLLDVLEHIAEDGSFLKTLVDKNLRAGGKALISLPAWPWLYSDHDRFLRHERRYRREEARRLVKEAGLRPLREGGYFYSLLPLRGLISLRDRVVGRRRPGSPVGNWHYGKWPTWLASQCLELDTYLSGWLSKGGLTLPGLSWWSLCLKP